MKILQINTCNYRRGGADVVYLNTSKLLRERGHEVVNFSKFSNLNIEVQNDKYFIKDINYFSLSPVKEMLNIPRFLYSLEAKEKIEKLIKEEKPDLAHIHLYKGILTSSILHPLKQHKIPIVITLHDYELLCPRSLFIDGKGKICEKCLISNNSVNCIINKCNRNNLLLSTLTTIEYVFHKRLFPFHKYFDKIIMVSRFGLQMHLKKTELKNKLVHLYNFYPKLETTTSVNIKGNYFLYYGRLSYEKGILTLLKAWKISKSDKILKIVGEGSLMQDIMEFIAHNEISNVEVLGYKIGSDLQILISNASFIIVPSECYENNPLTIIEAYSNGKPVIASKIGGIIEIVIENKTGFAFEMGNIEELANALDKGEKISDEEYSTLSKNARQYSIQYFSEEEHYIKLMNIYDSVLIKNSQEIIQRPIKVLHITNNYPTSNNPVFGIFVKEQIESLSTQGVENDVLFINGREGGKIEYIKSIWEIKKKLSNEKYDLIHCHHALSAIFLIISRENKRNKVIVSFQSDPRVEIGMLLYNRIRKNTTVSIFKNKSVLLKNKYSFHLPNGVNTLLFKPIDKSYARSILGLSPNNIYILFVSSNYIRREKRYDKFKDTLAILKKNNSKIEELILTNTEREFVPLYFNAADVHLLTSDFEGSPNSVKEAMACNIPVISTDVGDVKDLLLGVKDSFVSSSGDAIDLARLVETSLKEKEHNGREKLLQLNLDIDLVAKKLKDIYIEILV